MKKYKITIQLRSDKIIDGVLDVIFEDIKNDLEKSNFNIKVLNIKCKEVKK